jgi:hypothetical protein
MQASSRCACLDVRDLTHLRHKSLVVRSLHARMRLETHGTLARYEHYLALNLPVPAQASMRVCALARDVGTRAQFHSAATLRGDWLSRHYLIALLIDECEASLNADDRSLSRAAAALVRSVLAHHTSAAGDGNGNHKDAPRTRIADMFLPLLRALADHARALCPPVDVETDEVWRD